MELTRDRERFEWMVKTLHEWVHWYRVIRLRERYTARLVMERWSEQMEP